MRSSLPAFRGRLPRPARGYALLILMMAVTVLLISLTAALPNIYTAGLREREEELIFRGNEYARAIMLFHRQFNRYPASVEELMKPTNGFRFLRHAYKDPMSRDGKWRFIHANAAGVILDSLTMTPTNRPGGAPGGVNPAGGMNQQPGSAQNGGFSLGEGATASAQGQDHGQNATPGKEQDDNAPRIPGSPGNNQPGGLSLGPGPQTLGAFIVGVASSNHKRSIRIYNDRKRYDEWEFIAIAMGLQGGGPMQANPLGNPGMGGPAGAGQGPFPASGPSGMNPMPH